MATKKAKKKVVKKKITIEGKFTGPVNNRVTIDVYRSNSSPKPYEFKKTFEGNFKETVKDLEPGLIYDIDIAGYTTTKFELTISGEFETPNPIKETFLNTSFSRGYPVKTNK